MIFTEIIPTKEEWNDIDTKRHELEVSTANVIKRHTNWEKLNGKEISEVAHYYDDMDFNHKICKAIEEYLNKK